MKVYLIILQEFSGDTYIKVVDAETWAWVTSDDPGQPKGHNGDSSWLDQLVPASQAAKIKAAENAGEFEGVYITSGLWENDRAIFARPADGYEDIDDSSAKAAMKAIKAKGDDLEDQYVGSMY